MTSAYPTCEVRQVTVRTELRRGNVTATADVERLEAGEQGGGGAEDTGATVVSMPSSVPLSRPAQHLLSDCPVPAGP